MSYFRQAVLLSVGLATSLYILAVFHHLQTGLDLGLGSLVSGDSGPPRAGARLDAVDLSGPRDVVGRVPRVGDVLFELGNRRIESALDFRRQLNEFGKNVAPTGPLLPVLDDVASLPGSSDNLVQVNQSPWVRVKVRAASHISSDEQRAAYSTWLRLRSLPRSGLALSLIWLVLSGGLLVLGMVVVARRPGDPSATIFCGFCAVSVVTFLGTFHWSSLAGNAYLIYPLIFCGLLLAPLMIHLYLLFPRPLRWVRRRPQAVLSLVYLPSVALMLLMFGNLARLDRAYERGEAAALIRPALRAFAWQIDGAFCLSLLGMAVGVGILVLRFLRGRRGVQHRQVCWLLGGVTAALVPASCLLYLALTDRAAFAYGVSARWLLSAACLLLASTHAIGLTRHKLVPVGRLAFRGLWYLAISGAATLIYWVLVELLGPLAGRNRFHWLDAAVAALTALTLVALVGWRRDRFQRGWDRRYLVYKHQLDKAVRRLSAAVDQLVETSQLAKQMLQSARDVVAAERGAVYLLDPHGARLALAARVAWPNAPEFLHQRSPLTHELHHAGVVSARLGLAALPSAAQLELRDLEAELAFALEREGLLVGMLILGPKADGSAYSGEERNFLAALTRTTTLALRSAEENRTIERLKEDLHAKVSKIAEQQQRITFLQGQLLRRAPADRHAPLASVAHPAETETVAPDIRGSSKAVREMLDQVRKIAVSPSSVLVRGESGTGKELLAQAIHRNSPRAKAPFVAVHCAALSPGLLEAELFGHVKGAFTGADRDRPGRFELAHGGTLFLDEIGDIALDTQIKLLRVLQERAFERVGSAQRVQVDVRLIAATHQDLEALIRRGGFREDLFYRLNVISVRCPPLRERRDDIFELSLGFLQSYAERAGKHLVRIDEDAIDVLAGYAWPGNVRELENAIERGVVLAEGESITLADLPPELLDSIPHGKRAPRGRRENGRQRGSGASSRPASAPINSDLTEELTALERQRLLEVLAACGGNKSRAARQLGIPRSTLFSKLAKLDGAASGVDDG